MAQLLKVHGSQNQFFLLDQTTLARPLSDPERKSAGPSIMRSSYRNFRWGRWLARG